MNSQLVRHTLQEDLYSSKNYSSKDHMFQLLGEVIIAIILKKSLKSFSSNIENSQKF
mgnify:CR=1 FL=1